MSPFITKIFLFFLVGLVAKGLSVLLIFQKNQLSGFFFFPSIYLLSISFVSTLIFISSFLLLALALVYFFFQLLKVEGLVIDLRLFFFFFLIQECILISFCRLSF